MTDKQKDMVLKRFMKEFFPFRELCKVGFFTKEMKNDYKAQAERVCKRFGFETVFEYGAKEVKCHLTYGVDERPPDEPLVLIIPSIYD